MPRRSACFEQHGTGSGLPILSRKLLLILLLFSALTMLSAESWTVLVYMAADNNLAQQGKLDINSMESAAMPAGVNVIVQADFPEGASRYRVHQDNSSNITSPVLADLGDVDSGNPQTLNSFIKWGFAAYPAQRKMVVLWSHGDSWYKGEVTGDRGQVTGDRGQVTGDRCQVTGDRGQVSGDRGQVTGDGGGDIEPPAKWICPDDGSLSLMSVANGDLQIAFRGIPKLDILLFDACSMQSIEVLGEVYPYADYVIGSEDLVPVDGFPYEAIIPLFGGAFQQVLELIPDVYVSSYSPGGIQNPSGPDLTATCSTIATAAIPHFIADFKNFAINNLESAPILRQKRLECYAMNTGMADVDMYQLLWKLRDTGLPYAENLFWTWDALMVSICYSFPPSTGGHIGTAALWFPDIRFNFDNGWEHYSQLKFAQTRWLSVVNKALGEDTTAPYSPVLKSQSAVLSSLVLQIIPPPDPDSLYYELTLNDTRGQGTYWFYPDPDVDLFSVIQPITGAGSYALVAIDHSGNRSLPLSNNFGFSPPQVSLVIAPNPIRGKNLANLKWWADANLSGIVTLDMYNLRGQKVLSRNLGDVVAGESNYLLSADATFRNLAAGRYFISLQIGTAQLRRKLSILY